MDDRFDLNRFVKAQAPVYDVVLKELRAGQKRGYWIWYVFPRISGLGTTPTDTTYSIRTLAEARAYLQHPVLGSVDRVDDIIPRPGRVLDPTSEWTIRVTRHELGENTPAVVVATGQAEPLPAPRTVLRIFLKKDGPKHYLAVYWTTFATPRPRLPPSLRACLAAETRQGPNISSVARSPSPPKYLSSARWNGALASASAAWLNRVRLERNLSSSG